MRRCWGEYLALEVAAGHFIACGALIRDLGYIKAVFNVMKLIFIDSFSNPKEKSASVSLE